MKELNQTATKTSDKLHILLMDGNSERRTLRTKIMAMHGVEVTGACDLTEAGFMWDRDRYDMVLIDIRRDHRGCVAWRNEIKKERPKQVVAFLVGKPHFVDLAPEENSYTAETYATEWGDSLRRAIRQSCEALPQRNGLVEATWQISAAKKMHAMSSTPGNGKTTAPEFEFASRTKPEKLAATLDPVSEEPAPEAAPADPDEILMTETMETE